MSELVQGSAAPQRISDLRFECPRCRSSLDPEHGMERCAECGFAVSRAGGIIGFVTSKGEDDWLTFFEGRAAASGRNTTTGVGYRFPAQQRYIRDAFRTVIGSLPATALVLDVGCGNGTFADLLFGNRPIVGVDYSLGMCRLAQVRGMQVYQADATALPFCAAQFDLVYSAEVIQCFDSLSRFMAEISRVCRPGGRIIVSTLNSSSLLRRAARLRQRIFPLRTADGSGRLILRSAEEIVAAAARSGLRVRTICRSHFPFPWLYCSASVRHFLEPLATNLIIEFVKDAV